MKLSSLPPEIKSAGEQAMEIANRFHDNTNTSWEDYKLLASIASKVVNQRDLAIWNAAIEKAAHVDTEGSNHIRDMRQAILNLKLKE